MWSDTRTQIAFLNIKIFRTRNPTSLFDFHGFVVCSTQTTLDFLGMQIENSSGNSQFKINTASFSERTTCLNLTKLISKFTTEPRHCRLISTIGRSKLGKSNSLALMGITVTFDLFVKKCLAKWSIDFSAPPPERELTTMNIGLTQDTLAWLKIIE